MAVMATMANRYVSLTRRTPVVLAAASAQANMVASKSLRVGSYLEVTVAGGTTGSGTITLNGTDEDGNVLAELLTFTGNGVQQSTSRFATFTDLDTTGLADEAAVPTVAVRAVSVDGQPHDVQTVVVEGRPAVYQPLGGAGWPAAQQGSQVQGRAYFDLDYEEVYLPQVGDLLVDDVGDQYEIKVVDRPERYGMYYWRITADRYTG